MTKQDKGELEIVGWFVRLLYNKEQDIWSTKLFAETLPTDVTTYQIVQPLTPHAPAQARIEQLQSDLVNTRAQLDASRTLYEQETSLATDLQAQVTRLREALEPLIKVCELVTFLAPDEKHESHCKCISCLAKNAREALSNTPAPKGGAVRVKALSWEPCDTYHLRAETEVGIYYIDNNDGWWTFIGDQLGSGFEDHATPEWTDDDSAIDEMKAAAQADYEARILSTLEPKEG